MSDIETGVLHTVDQIHDHFAEMHANYYTYEWTWKRMERCWSSTDWMQKQLLRKDIINIVHQWQQSVVWLDKMVYEDAKRIFAFFDDWIWS